MPRRKEIRNQVGSELYSMQIYNGVFDFQNFNPMDTFTKWAALEIYNGVFDFQNFNPMDTFTKWAALEVTDFEYIPEEMESYTLKGAGLL
eukprot:gene42048-56931_t